MTSTASAIGQTLRLVLSTEFGEARVWDFIGPRAIVIGRGEGSALQLSESPGHQPISRHHAVIELGRGKAVVRDLNSLNGTYVNGHLVGRRITESEDEPSLKVNGQGVTLSDGDLLTLGPHSFRIGLVSGDDEEPAVGLSDVNPDCPGCGRRHQPVPISRYADVLCATCQQNPLASLKLLKAGLSRRVKSLDPLKGLRIAKTLGRGATSAVFLAYKKNSGDKMALKVMPPSISENEWARKSFLREVAIGRALRHPHVVRLFDFGFYGGAYFYLMEYCPGGTGEEMRLKQGGTLTPEEALKIILPILDGLDYLHHVKLAAARAADVFAPQAEGLVHRDLKPANIFLCGENCDIPKIADIGVGKIHRSEPDSRGSDHTRTGSGAGSPATMPRQQVLNFKYVGPEVDVWASAATLYKLLTGQYPREFPKDQDPWRAVLSQPVRPVLSLRSDLPAHLAQALDEALIDDPEPTHKTAMSFKRSLMRAAYKDNLFSDAQQTDEKNDHNGTA